MSSTVEPEWDDLERDWMLARQHYRDANLCSLCGMPKEICRSIDTDGFVQVEAQRCHITAAIARKQRANHKDETVEVPESLVYSAAIKTPPAS